MTQVREDYLLDQGCGKAVIRKGWMESLVT